MSSRELLDRLRNLGGPLGPDPKERLRSVLVRPSAATWMNSYSICVTSWGTSLVQALGHVDDRWTLAQEQGENWLAIVPDSFLVRRALVWAIEDQEKLDRVINSRQKPNPV